MYPPSEVVSLGTLLLLAIIPETREAQTPVGRRFRREKNFPGLSVDSMAGRSLHGDLNQDDLGRLLHPNMVSADRRQQSDLDVSGWRKRAKSFPIAAYCGMRGAC